MPSPQQLLAAFDLVGGRARQVLVSRVLEGKSAAAVAAWLGTSAEAVNVLLFRALAELEAALASPPRAPPPAEPLPDAEEQAAAWALANALDSGRQEARGPLLERRFALCQALRAAPEVKQALVLPPPPPPTPLEHARRLLWVALVIAAAVLYWKYFSQPLAR